MKDHIARLGFDAWADNKFVNAIEDYRDVIGTGNISIEDDECCIKFFFTEKTISCIIRAYTESGWQTYEKYIKRPQENL